MAARVVKTIAAGDKRARVDGLHAVGLNRPAVAR
jgi:hypothetical protein